jgi:hypothetical protein
LTIASRRGYRRSVRSLFLAVLATLLLASPAAAAPTWLAPVTVSPEADGQVAQFAVGSDNAGHVAGVWQRLTGAQGRIDYSLRSPGGGFTAAKTLSTGGVHALDPAVDVDAGGTATVAWSEPDGIKVTRVAADGTAAAVETLGGAGAAQPQVAVAPNGAAVLAWEDGGGTVIAAASRAAGAATFVGAGTISPAGTIGSNSPRVAIDANGNALVAWIDAGNGTNEAVRANRRPAGGNFAGTAEIVLAPQAGDLFDLALAMAPDGRATTMWSNTTAQIVQTSERTISPDFAGGSWSPVGQASPPGVQAGNPSVAIDAQNTAIAVWRAKQGMNEFVQGSRRLSGGSFADFQPLSGAGASFDAQIDVAPDGSAVAIWSGLAGTQLAIQASRREPNGGFGAVANVALGDGAATPPVFVFTPAVAVDDQGNAAAFWARQRNDGGGGINDWRADAAGFDAAAPTLTAVSIPPGGSVNAGIGMAAAATDRWTPVSYAWNFGDGTTGAGPAVTHAFGTAGAFNVTLDAVDGVGNTASATGPVLITATDPPKKKRITSRVNIRWGVTSSKIFLIRLKIPNLPKRAKAKITCRGKKCPFKQRSSKKRKKGTITLFKEVKTTKVAGMKKRTFLPGQRVELRLTAPGYIGKVLRYKLKRAKVPTAKTLCIPAGAKKARKRCP